MVSATRSVDEEEGGCQDSHGVRSISLAQLSCAVSDEGIRLSVMMLGPGLTILAD